MRLFVGAKPAFGTAFRRAWLAAGRKSQVGCPIRSGSVARWFRRTARNARPRFLGDCYGAVMKNNSQSGICLVLTARSSRLDHLGAPRAGDVVETPFGYHIIKRTE